MSENTTDTETASSDANRPEFPVGTVLGYPRIGRHRELKRALERYWKGASSREDLLAVGLAVRDTTRRTLATLGLAADDASIPEAWSSYDQVLDTAVALGALPKRFADLAAADGSIGLDAAFTLARGDKERPALEMTKWFDTNYHYLVPEIGPDTTFHPANRGRADEVREALDAGFATRPALIGPITFLLLSKSEDGAPDGFAPIDRLDDVLPVYVELLRDLADAGAAWVQLDESALVSENLDVDAAEYPALVRRAYGALAAASGIPAIFVATAYATLGDDVYGALAEYGAAAIGFDAFRGTTPSDAVLRAHPEVTAVVGVIEGRNIWRGDLAWAFTELERIRALGVPVAVSTSTSLQHVPHTLEDESALDARLRSWLAFADEKVAQVVTLARGLTEGRDAIESELEVASAALADRATAPGVRDGAVRDRAERLTLGDFNRGPDAERAAAQRAELGLPLLPTTTIGSFPQTEAIRTARHRFRAHEIDEAQYEGFLREEIARVIRLQEELGLDVLVHGEAERNDMVQYFAEQLDGFSATENGWVQSYGSRCTRPSILWGDVARTHPMTVRWSTYAQSLTDKRVKGMLTGPVTILAWSFVRDDEPLGETANQVALALRDEVADLQDAGIRIIQVDEPALRELLPLKRADQPAYLDWSVSAFRLATGAARTETQVHTHLCYSEFGQIIDAIDGLDADVTSIEAARSRMEVVGDIKRVAFSRGIGPGVYDIHSPRVPAEEEIEDLLHVALGGVPAQLLWVNPDCGLKTRGYDETVASLRNLVGAARAVRAEL